MVEVEQKAPDFTLPNEEKQFVTLSKELGHGPIVLSFYFMDFSSVCTKQSCDFRDRMGELQKVGAKVFGISTDSPFSHKAFKDANQINYPLLSDWNKEATNAYGVQYAEVGPMKLRGVSKRSVFVIDKQGVVRYKWVTEDPAVPPNVHEVVEAVKKLAP